MMMAKKGENKKQKKFPKFEHERNHAKEMQVKTQGNH